MKVIVIGGAGFIGSNLIPELLNNGHDVLSIDNYLTGSEKNHCFGADYIYGCASTLPYINYKADIVFHLGEYSRVEQSDIEPWICLKNTYKTLPSVLEYCAINKSKLIYSGSSTKFSDVSNPYIVSKQLNTILVKSICEQYGIEYAITYFYNVYGKNEIGTGLYATVVAKFLIAKKQGSRVMLTGTGEQRRNFTHIDDIVDGLIIVANKGYGDDYGIGAENSYSIKELADIIGLQYGYEPDKPSNRKESILVTKKTNELGWKACRDLKEYVEKKMAG
ncbi:MAG: NAD-dependent epimerase/dehydratase family protein [Ferruginibacter sp.]